MSRNTNYERKDRLSSLIRQILSDELSRSNDQSLMSVSITEVRVDNNLNHAQVLVTTIELSSKSEILRLLRKNLPVFMKALSSQTNFKQLPKLSFAFDRGLEETYKIEEIIKGINTEYTDTTDA